MCSEIFAVQQEMTASYLDVRIAVAYTNMLQYIIFKADLVCRFHFNLILDICCGQTSQLLGLSISY